MMARGWTNSEDTAVQVQPGPGQRAAELAAALDYEDGGQRLREFVAHLGRTEAAVRQRAWRLARGPVCGQRRVTTGHLADRVLAGPWTASVAR